MSSPNQKVVGSEKEAINKVLKRSNRSISKVQNTSDKKLKNNVVDEISNNVHVEIAHRTMSFTENLHRSWGKKEIAEITLRSVSLVAIFFILWKQLSFINELVMGIAKKDLHLDIDILKLIITGVLVEVTALVGIALRYLFQERTTNVLNIVKDVFNNMSINNNDFKKEKKDSK